MTETVREGWWDLHTHSVVSDGTSTPTDIARLVAAEGLAGFSLTDHDTTDGWDAARAAAREHGVGFLPGIELTTDHLGRSVHLLAYGPDPRDPHLTAELTRLRTSRFERMGEMIRRLQKDFPFDWNRLLVDARETQSFGRPHLADALVEGGYFRDRSAAFADVLSTRSQYYVPIYATETITAIELVAAAGGVSVIAHPAASRLHRPIEVDVIEELADAGLDGIELNHPENLDEWLGPLREAATRRDLIVTGASDYHGDGKPNRLGECRSDAETVARIRALARVPA